MKFIVFRKDIVPALAAAGAAVAKNPRMAILGHYLLTASEHEVEIAATDLELSLRVDCDAEVAEPGSVAVPAAEFARVVGLLPADAPIEVRRDGGRVEVRCGRSRTRMSALDAETFPAVPAPPPDMVRVDGHVVADLIRKTVRTTAADDQHWVLRGVRLFSTPNGVRAVSTDGHRMSVADRWTDRPPPECFLPKRFAAEALKALEKCDGFDHVAFGSDDAHVHIQIPDRTLSGRKLAGLFPNVDAVMPQSTAHGLTVASEDLRGAILRSAVLSDQQTCAVALRIDGGCLTVLGADAARGGDSENSIGAECSAPPAELRFDHRFIVDFLDVCGPCEVEVRWNEPDGPTVWSCATSGKAVGNDYRQVIMPMEA